MLKKTAGVLFWWALLCGTCFGQTPLHGLVAGQSVRADVERVAGKPVKVYSQTLVEYHPYEFDSKNWDKNVAKMYVQYRTDSPIIERMELLLGRPISRSDAFKNLEVSTAAARQPHLPDQPTARGKNGDRLVEYFGVPFYLVLTYQGADASSGVARTARYSKELFDSAVSSPSSNAPASASATESAGGDPSQAKPSGSTAPTKSFDDTPHSDSGPPSETTASAGRTDDSTPNAYSGPSSGTITWSGKTDQDQVITIEGDHSASGSVEGGLPGVPVQVDLDTREYAVVEAPAPSNGWKRLSIRSKHKRQTVISIRWVVLQ